MGEEKINERNIPGLMDNITKYDVGTGVKFQITLGKRAGFGDNESNHFHITIPAEGTRHDLLFDILFHINEVAHNAIHAARRYERSKLQRQLQELLGLDKR